MATRTEIIIEQVADYSKGSDYSSFNVVRVHGDVLENLGGRNRWVKIQNYSPTSDPIYRIAKGLKGVTHFTKKSIQLDYDSRCELNISSKTRSDDKFFPAKLKIAPANSIQVLFSLWFTNDPTFRIPLQISLISLFIGVAGFVISIFK